jgi:hypothetical protein
MSNGTQSWATEFLGGPVDFPERSLVVFTNKQMTIVDLDARQEWLTFHKARPSWWRRLVHRTKVWWQLWRHKQLEVRGLWGDPRAKVQFTRRPGR